MVLVIKKSFLSCHFQLKKAKISKMPSLPEIQLPDLATPEPVYTPTVRPPNPPLKSESEKKKSRGKFILTLISYNFSIDCP